MKTNEFLWWGYLHTSGTYQAKRYFDETGDLDIEDAQASPFCKVVVGPFKANGRDDALSKIKSMVEKETINPLLEKEIITEVERDTIRLDFLQWLDDKDYLIDEQLHIWENYITEKAKNE